MVATTLLVACGDESGGGASGGARGGADPVAVAGTTTADVSTIDGYIEALAAAFIAGEDAAMAAVVFPNEDMMKAHILRHQGPANAEAAIRMLDMTMPADLNRVLSSLKSARQEAVASGFDASDATFHSAKKISGLSIGGMKVNTLGMNIQSGGRVYAFELSESRDILGRWVTMGQTSFAGVTGGTPVKKSDGSLDLDL
ncbi:MAG: hypothetical protein ACFB6R_04360 [Alphaproteobacteria bacterium]